MAWGSMTMIRTCGARAGGPVYTSIVKAVTDNLAPTEVELIDDSASHAGHAGMKVLLPERAAWEAAQREPSMWLMRLCARKGPG